MQVFKMRLFSEYFFNKPTQCLECFQTNIYYILFQLLSCNASISQTVNDIDKTNFIGWIELDNIITATVCRHKGSNYIDF